MSDQPLDSIRITIPAKPDYVGVARLVVSGIANRMGFSYDDIEDVKLAVAEACTNAVDHAYIDNEGEIEISCGVFPDRLQVAVADHGNSFDIGKVEERTGPLSIEPEMNALRERGLGIFLIKSLMDTVDIKDDNGVIVTMIKYIQKDEVDSHVDSSKSYSSNQ